ncbi:MAG: substrate-binding domain-containing protein [Chromatiales bacterium]
MHRARKNLIWDKFSTLFLAILLAPGSLLAASLTVAGTGDSQALLRNIAKAYSTAHPAEKIVIPDSIGSRGGIRALTQGKVPMARTARPLKPNEAKPGFNEHLFARSPVVIAVNPSVSGLTGLSSEQIIDIFSGRITRWEQVGGPQGKIYVVEREAGDSSRSVLEKQLSGFKEFKPVGKVFFSTQEAADAIATHANTIGFLPLSEAIRHNLNIVAVDGVRPDEASVQSGAYAYVTSFYLTSRSQPEGLAHRFLEYIYSDSAQEIIRETRVVPVARQEPDPAGTTE